MNQRDYDEQRLIKAATHGLEILQQKIKEAEAEIKKIHPGFEINFLERSYFKQGGGMVLPPLSISIEQWHLAQINIDIFNSGLVGLREEKIKKWANELKKVDSGENAATSSI